MRLVPVRPKLETDAGAEEVSGISCALARRGSISAIAATGSEKRSKSMGAHVDWRSVGTARGVGRGGGGDRWKERPGVSRRRGNSKGGGVGVGVRESPLSSLRALPFAHF